MIRFLAPAFALVAAGCEADPIFLEKDLIELAWPIEGDRWVVQFYVDHDESADFSDYNGGKKTYNGHAGTDVTISSFRTMEEGVEVRASTAGTVVEVEDGHFDRETVLEPACAKPANQVVVRVPAAGAYIRYLHFKRGSIQVNVGDTVEVGDVLGLVGSSGCSDWPHVHVEVNDAFGRVYDPFVEGWWIDPPVYDQPLVFLEAWIVEGDLAQDVADRLLDVPETPLAFDRDRELTVALRYAGGTPEESTGLDVVDDSDAIVTGFRGALERPFRISTWTWPFTPRTPGAWEARAMVNNEEADVLPFEVR